MTTSLAAIATQAANPGGNAISQALLANSKLIEEYASGLRVNKDAASALSRRINDLVAVIIAEPGETEETKAGGDWFSSVEALCGVLKHVRDTLDELQRRSYIVQLLHRERDAATLRALSENVKSAVDRLMLKTRVGIVEQLSDLNDNLTQLADLHIAAPDLVTVAPGLPLSMHYYFGRSSETQRAVALVTQDGPAYIAILGGPGMGKTSLALAVLHDDAVAARFGSNRHFIACDAADSHLNCASMITSAFGIATTNMQDAQRQLVALLSAQCSLLVLDNFESAWEKAGVRQNAEDMLTFLAGIPMLTLVITMRGSERPHGVPWTRPFLPPLQPVDEDAAFQILASLSDVRPLDTDVPRLLGLLDGIPLAIVLAAHMAQYESLSQLLDRWDLAKTRTLSYGGGTTRLTNLDISIQLSLDSPRMSEHGESHQLLGLLSLLPQGAFMHDIISCSASLSDPKTCLSTLLQTALARRMPDGRIHVLAPIQGFILDRYPPTDSLALPLYDHYFALAILMAQESVQSSLPGILAEVSPEIDNPYSVIHYALEHAAAPDRAVQAAVSVLHLLFQTGVGYADIYQSVTAL